MPPTPELKQDDAAATGNSSKAPKSESSASSPSSSSKAKADASHGTAKNGVGAAKENPHGPMKERDIVEFTHNHAFMHVVGAFFNKFPDKDFPDVHSVKITEREYDAEKKILKLTRLFEIVNPAPYLLRVLFKSPYWRFEEIVIVDFENCTVELRSVNLDFRSIVDTFEKSFFRKHPEHADKTLFKQVAGMALNPLACLGLNRRIEEHALTKVKKSAALAIKLFEKKLDALEETPAIPGFDVSVLEVDYRESTEAILP